MIKFLLNVEVKLTPPTADKLGFESNNQIIDDLNNALKEVQEIYYLHQVVNVIEDLYNNTAGLTLLVSAK